MLVHQFLHYMKSAALDLRVEAVAEFARLYLDGVIARDEHQQAEAAMVLMLDDKDLAVRRALAQVLAPSKQAPFPVILGLMQDDATVAAIVARHSPLLTDSDLSDLICSHDAVIQIAVADREKLTVSVARILALKAGLEACLALLDNAHVKLNADVLNTIIERFGDDADIREAFIKRPDLPVATQQAMIVKLSQTMLPSAKDNNPRSEKMVKDARERATVALAARLSDHQPLVLVRHLIESGQLTASLLLRVVLSGNMAFFETALAELAGFSTKRVAGLVHDRRGTGFKALYEDAGLPASAFPAFAAAINTYHEDGMVMDDAADARLKRRMVERALTSASKHSANDSDQLMVLLRRFQAEIIRDEARALADDMAESLALPFIEPEQVPLAPAFAEEPLAAEPQWEADFEPEIEPQQYVYAAPQADVGDYRQPRNGWEEWVNARYSPQQQHFMPQETVAEPEEICTKPQLAQVWSPLQPQTPHMTEMQSSLDSLLSDRMNRYASHLLPNVLGAGRNSKPTHQAVSHDIRHRSAFSFNPFNRSERAPAPKHNASTQGLRKIDPRQLFVG